MTATTLQDRCFSCTFCHRKFTSAQALGGHMNLHRRERARLQTHFPPSLFSDPQALFGHRFWAFEQNPVFHNKMLFDPSTTAFVTHQTDVSSKLECDAGHHRMLKKPINKFRRQHNLVKLYHDNPVDVVAGGQLDLELRLGQSLT